MTRETSNSFSYLYVLLESTSSFKIELLNPQLKSQLIAEHSSTINNKYFLYAIYALFITAFPGVVHKLRTPVKLSSSQNTKKNEMVQVICIIMMCNNFVWD